MNLTAHLLKSTNRQDKFNILDALTDGFALMRVNHAAALQITGALPIDSNTQKVSVLRKQNSCQLRCAVIDIFVIGTSSPVVPCRSAHLCRAGEARRRSRPKHSHPCTREPYSEKVTSYRYGAKAVAPASTDWDLRGANRRHTQFARRFARLIRIGARDNKQARRKSERGINAAVHAATLRALIRGRFWPAPLQ